MLPILLDLPFIRIYTFGAFLVLAFFWGMFLLWRNIKLTPYREEEMFDGVFVALFFGLFFGRTFFVAMNFEKFGFSPLKFILINGFPGFSLYGALLGGILGLFLFFRARKIEFLKAVDYFVPPLFLSLAIGKVGSFLGGVDVGVVTRLPLAVQYTGYEGVRHLTALYESLLFGVAVYLSYRLVMMIRRDRLVRGFALYFFTLYFAVTNLLLDNLKVNHLYLAGLNFNVAVSLVLTLFFATYFVFYFRANIAGGVLGIWARAGIYGKKTHQNTGKKAKGAP